MDEATPGSKGFSAGDGLPGAHDQDSSGLVVLDFFFFIYTIFGRKEEERLVPLPKHLFTMMSFHQAI